MKKHVSLLLIAFMGISLVLGGCGKSTSGTPATEARTEAQAGTQTEAQADAQTINQNGEKASQDQASESASGAVSSSESGSGDELNTGFDENKLTCQAAIRVGSLKGPTSMGLVSLMDKASRGETSNVYEFTMAGKADELVGKIANGDLDIALLPANVASVLYAKTQGNITVLDINTLGVLYVVASDDSISSMADLKGRTIYMTGKGTTPDYVLQYLLSENGLTTDDVTIEYKSEATEVAAVLKEQEGAIGLLPQPFVTVAMAQNESLKMVLDLTKEWEAIQGGTGGSLVTGVTICRSELFADPAGAEAIDVFLAEHKASAMFAIDNVAETADLVAAAGIIEKAPVAAKAIPYCSITFVDGEMMKSMLDGYLTVLFDQDPASVGGTLPDDAFYYIP